MVEKQGSTFRCQPGINWVGGTSGRRIRRLTAGQKDLWTVLREGLGEGGDRTPGACGGTRFRVLMRGGAA